MYGLLDGDIVLFRCGFAAERTRWHLAWEPMYEKAPDGEAKLFQGEFRKHEDFEYKREAMDRLDEVLPGIKTRVETEDYLLWPEKQLEPLSHALNNVRTLVDRLCKSCQINPFDLKVYFSEGRTFRHELAVTREYKGNRDKDHRPTYEKDIRAFMKETYDCYVGDNEEADDLLGINATKYGPRGAVIISLDKDLDQIPGLKYNWLHDVHYEVSEKQAIYNFHKQLLTGDSTDNIPGLPGIGPGKAAKALHALETAEEQLAECARMYQVHSGKADWLEYMTEQGRLVYIRRQPGELWTPNIEVVDDGWGDGNLTLEVD
jgi:hypothetical protein